MLAHTNTKRIDTIFSINLTNNFMATNNLTTPCYQLYQDLVDSIFGNSVVKIKPDVDNNVIGTLKYTTEFLCFKKNFTSRLIRLRDRYAGTCFFNDLIKTVAQVADSKNWEGAYAELVAYDVMSNDYLPDAIELNKTLPVSESFAGRWEAKKPMKMVLLANTIYILMSRFLQIQWVAY